MTDRPWHPTAWIVAPCVGGARITLRAANLVTHETAEKAFTVAASPWVVADDVARRELTAWVAGLNDGTVQPASTTSVRRIREDGDDFYLIGGKTA